MAALKNQVQEHWLSRDYETSARLYLQHWLFQSTIGYVVDPVIVSELRSARGSSKEPLKIADLACGNAAWLLEIASDVSSVDMGADVELYGFDISPSHFPVDVPSNVHLLERNILDPAFIKEFEGSFDIVHIRAFGSSIKNSDTSPVCHAVESLLKPGGYIQWEEMDQSNMNSVLEGKPAPQATALIHLLTAAGKATETTFDWFDVLGQQVEASGFGEVVTGKYPSKAHHRKAWTEDYLLAYRDIGQMLPSENDAPGSPMTREGYNKLFAGVVEEARRGMVMLMNHLLTVRGKK